MKILILFFLKFTGVIWAFRFLCRDKIIIFSLHGVMDEEETSSWFPLRPQVSRNTLDSVLCVLSRYYNFVSLEKAVAMLNGEEKLIPNSVVLTFDDGYRNNITHALPVLQSYKVPATFFLATGYVDNNKPFWFDRLDYALQKGNVDGRSICVAGQSVVIDSSSRVALGESYKDIRRIGKMAKRNDKEMVDEMEDLAAKIEKESGNALQDILSTDPWTAVLSWDEVKAAVKLDGVSFGSHTVEHVRLGLVDTVQSMEELSKSKIAIEENLGIPCLTFCYPIGSYSGHVTEIVKQCGYTAAVTTVKGVNKPGCDTMKLNRIPLPDTCSPVLVLFIASGLSDAYQSLKNYFHNAK